MSFHFDSALRYQSTMSTQASASKTPPEDTLFLAEIERLDVSRDGQADEAYLESLAELKHAVELISKPRGNKHVARL
ncbi:hypothetical protein FOQG_10906 [Fusarium oxysporum f. sp. raphani 54005]|uniref:Uncharacterized protein n=4 Tax=Fusarium oxysporum species complex TaxID=171631 RepID=X0CR05_FUSOX|nr:uncharacterized protein FOIG_13771 [Fusarium odoratissimum NRRL 54006]EXK84942.1 hypothetical protein FOQG_10906 [Fusarium oxysporum f. sp. raphani 54005]EXL93366.1 hypothetical protein FOIG_13771 [Fusarium odoratissimum NRRL 54006]KAK2134449.1 hypothetical protein NOF04DRAFT_13949 [Fusarium oxysporum II5]TXC10745.1 hypothetical protein FocTR4_00007716 [Fusarium oxysporum f. sp. cubense]